MTQGNWKVCRWVSLIQQSLGVRNHCFLVPPLDFPARLWTMAFLHLLLLHLKKHRIKHLYHAHSHSFLFLCSQIFGFTDHLSLDWLFIIMLTGAVEREINLKDNLQRLLPKAIAYWCGFACSLHTLINVHLVVRNRLEITFYYCYSFFLGHFQSQVRILHSSEHCLVSGR